MPRGKELSDSEKARILAFHEVEMPLAEIARRLGRSKSAVQHVVSPNHNYYKKKRCGRRSKLTERDQRRVVKHLSNSVESVRKAPTALGLGVSRETVRRTVKKSGVLQYSKKKTSPALQKKHKEARISFCRANITRDWSKVVFSDEKKWNLDGPDTFAYYWHNLRKNPLTHTTRNFGGGSVMTWAAISSFGTVDLVITTCRMSSQDYVDILDRSILPDFRRNYRRRLVYQHDNASLHTSTATVNHLSGNNISVLSWPARSPDLNIVENVWGYLVRRVYENGKQYATVADLQAGILKEWANIDNNYLSKLYSSISNRLCDVLQRNGSACSY